MRLVITALLAAAVGSAPSAAWVAATPIRAAKVDYCVLSVEEDRGQLAILKPDGRRVASVPIGERPHEVEVSRSGATAYVTQFGIADYDHRIGAPGNKIIEVNLRTASVVGTFTIPTGSLGPHGVKLRPGSGELFVNTEVNGDKMFVFDTDTRLVRRSFALPKGTHNFIFSSDGRTLYSFAGKGGLSKLDAVSGRIAGTIDAGSPIRGLALNSAGEVLASGRGEVLIIDHAFRVTRRLKAPVGGQLLYLTQLANGDLAVPAMNDNGIVIFFARRTKFVRTGRAPIFARQAPDGLIYVANVEDTYLSVLSPSGKRISRIDGVLTPNGLAFAGCPKS